LKILVAGGGGFIGKVVVGALSKDHEVFVVERSANPQNSKSIQLDLTQKKALVTLFRELRPDIVINCAGIIDPNGNVVLNRAFTMNILESLVASGHVPKRVIIMGSAAEYGEVKPDELPISEDTPLRAKSGYGLSKIQETAAALEYGGRNNIPIVIARIFNPIGKGMRPKFITSRVQQQLREFNEGVREVIDAVYRLDALRDYVSVHDIADAIKTLVEHNPKESVYNIGSGKATSNQEIVDLLIAYTPMVGKPEVRQTADTPEPLVAAQADISRMRREFGWRPRVSLEEAVKEVIDTGSNEQSN